MHCGCEGRGRGSGGREGVKIKEAVEQSMSGLNIDDVL